MDLEGLVALGRKYLDAGRADAALAVISVAARLRGRRRSREVFDAGFIAGRRRPVRMKWGNG